MKDRFKFTITVTGDYNDDDQNIYIRAATQKAVEVMDLIGRGKFQIEKSCEVIKCRLLVKKPNKRRK
jgi:hypothetical protein